MARDYVSIGSSPVYEDTVQVGSENYHDRASEECSRFIALLRATFGEEPAGAELLIKTFPHDFGHYLEVVCYFKEDDEAARNYAAKLEDETPERWNAATQPRQKSAPFTIGAVLEFKELLPPNWWQERKASVEAEALGLTGGPDPSELEAIMQSAGLTPDLRHAIRAAVAKMLPSPNEFIPRQRWS